MTVKRAILFLILLPAAALQAANDFSSDPNCVALWRFENGALTTDSKGTNTLTASVSPPTADTVNFEEGAASADFERDSSQNFSCNDGDLDAGFPGKNAEAGYDFSVTFFTKPESLATLGFMAKGNTWTGWSVLLIGPRVYLYCPGTGGNLSVSHVTGLVAGTRYFVAVTLENAGENLNYRIHIYDLDADAVHGTDLAGNLNGAPNTSDTDSFRIGSQIGYGYFDGLIDELAVFNDALTADEIDQIRGGTYGATSAVNNWWWRRRNP